MEYDWEFIPDELPGWTYDDAVGDVVAEFPCAWEKYWGLDARECPEHLEPGEWELAKKVRADARRICHSAADLQGAHLPDHFRTFPAELFAQAEEARSNREELSQMLREDLLPEHLELPSIKDLLNSLKWNRSEKEEEAALFRTAVEIYSFPDFGCLPGGIAARLLELLDFLVRTRGERTREYRRRVAVCYIRDMQPEMAVMSRSVMESALQANAIETRVEANLKVQK